MVSLENKNVVCCVEEEGNSCANSMTAFLSTAAWEDIMTSHKMMKFRLLSSLSGDLCSWVQTEFTRPRWQTGKNPGVMVLRSRWSHFPKPAPGTGAAGGCVAVVRAVYLCTVILGSWFRPQQHPAPTFSPSFLRPDGGGAGIRGKGGGSAQDKSPTQTSIV